MPDMQSSEAAKMARETAIGGHPDQRRSESKKMITLSALDLFCGAGGVTRGLQLAGFRVTGVDIEPRPNYIGDHFVQADVFSYASKVDLGWYDLIWASPPCQPFVSLKWMHNARPHADLIYETRRILQASGRPYVIENVAGAPLENPICLCGSMFGLSTPSGAQIRRHRFFEANFQIPAEQCRHGNGPVIGIYGGHYRDRRRKGEGDHRGQKDFTPEEARQAMGINWRMTGDELSQAIPPAYARLIGHAARCHILPYGD